MKKLTDFELKRKHLEQRNITLEEALEEARAWEAAGRQATIMTVNPVVMEGDSVSAVKTREEKADDKPRKCYICGKEGHLAIVKNCAGKGTKCAIWGRYGNSALCRIGKGDNYAIRGSPEQGRRGSGKRQSYNANFVGDH